MAIQPIHKILPPGWIIKTEAVKLLNRSVKTFEQIVRAQGVESQLLENKGKRATPIYRQGDIERLVRGPVVALAPTPPLYPIQPPIQPIQPSPQKLLPAPAPAMPVSQLHLITAKQAHELGYPYQLLRELKARPNPPGLKYGKTGFRFSVSALLREMTNIGLDEKSTQTNSN